MIGVMVSTEEKANFEESYTISPQVIQYIQQAAQRGVYDIRGMGAKRVVPNFDDLVFLTASMSRYPLEGYREKCQTTTILGGQHAKQPIELDIPITIAGMSFGALGVARSGTESADASSTSSPALTPLACGPAT